MTALVSRSAMPACSNPEFAAGSGFGLAMLFVGPLVQGGTCLQRMHALEELGCMVHPIDTRPPWLAERMRGLPWRIRNRLLGARDETGLNDLLLMLSREPVPDLVWVEKGDTIEAGTLLALRARWPRTVFVHFSPDDTFNPHNQSRQYLEGIALYDLHVTTKTFNVSELRAAGAPGVHFMGKGFSPQVHRPIPLRADDVARFGGDVGFIGWPERERRQSMEFLARHGVRVRVWGPWSRWWPRHPNLRIEGRPLWGDDYARAIQSFRINLCFLRKVNRDRHTTRSVEIPACGAFMLGERTDEHLALFEEGREAAYFSSNQELLQKVRYYLAHEDERLRIAAAGRRRCLEDRYDYASSLSQALQQAIGGAHARTCPLALVPPGRPPRRVAYWYREMAEYIQSDLDIIASRAALTVEGCATRWPRPLRVWRRIASHDAAMAWFASWHSLWPALAARLQGKPMLVVVGGYDTASLPEIRYGHQRGGLRRFVARAVMALATKLLVISRFGMSEALAAGARGGKLILVPLGLDARRYPSPGGPRGPVAVTVAGVNRSNLTRKGLETFVRAAAFAPEIEFVLIGGWMDDAIDRLRAVAPSNVRFTGRLTHEEKVEWLGRARVAVQASQHEAFGLSLAEGMLCGAVPVVTRAGALPEVVGDTGLVVADQDPAKLAAAVRDAVASWPELGPRARARIASEFSIERRARGLEAAIDGAMSREAA